MLEHLGFSYIGLIYLLMLFIPNIIWSRSKSSNYEVMDENKILLALERIGQVMVVVFALFFTNYNLKSLSIWTLWLVVSIFIMILYEMAWVNYFKKEHIFENLYGDFFKIPIPLASLPVLGFLLLGFYEKSILLIISTIILGIGHIGIHIQYLNKISKNNKI